MTKQPFFSKGRCELRSGAFLAGGVVLSWLLGAFVMLAVSFPLSLSAHSFYVNYSKQVPVADVLAHPESILHPTVDLDPAVLSAAGHASFGYLSVGEVAADATYRAEVKRRGIPVLMTNAIWQSDVIDLSASAWREYVVEVLAKPIADRGFAGFFLDTMDAVDMLSARNPDAAAAYRSGLVQLVRDLHARYPEMKIIANRGFSVLGQLGESVDGVLVESVFASFDPESGKAIDVAPEQTDAILNLIQPYVDAGKGIYVLDYSDPEDLDAAAAASEKASQRGFHTFVSTPDLSGRSLAPLNRLQRKVLVLYGNDPKSGPYAARFPVDSATFLTIHMCFEWLGIEVEYFNAFEQAFRFDPRSEYRAILADQSLVVPPQHQQALVDSLLAANKQGVKLIFAGSLPVSGWVQSKRLFDALGLTGSGHLVPNIDKQRFLVKDPEIMDFREKVRLVPFDHLNLQAPESAERYLSVVSDTSDGGQITYDAVFTADWGGAMLEPYLFFTRPNYDALWLLNPFRFLAKALDLPDFPVPDTTTRDGVRLFYSHIDGDGFANISEVDPNRRSSEIVRDYILSQYPLPITFSVIEAEVEALSRLQKIETAPELREIARSIFRLPNVQAASHAYSHPFYWIDDDPRGEIYDGRHLPMKNNYRFSLEREIGGSVDYINQELLPEGKSVELFLWSGNCRPSVEAMKQVRDLGIFNMNGGDTLISAGRPSLSFVSPRTLFWDGEVQVLAANQNENVYTHNWTGPFFGMYSKVIDTFERTEKPWRLKPVNVYFHNYCGDKPDGLQSLRTVFDWVMSQELHPVTAYQYAEIASDSRFTSVYKAGSDRWVIVNDGKQRTFRMRKGNRVPDVGRSHGVLGFRESGESVYVHTTGERRTEMVLVGRDELGAHPYLVSSTGELDWHEFGASELSFTALGFRPAEIHLGGLEAGQSYRVAMGDQESVMDASGEGGLSFDVAENTRVTVRVASQVAGRDE